MVRDICLIVSLVITVVLTVSRRWKKWAHAPTCACHEWTPRANHSVARAVCQHARPFEIIVTEQLLGYEPSIVSGVKMAYVW